MEPKIQYDTISCNLTKNILTQYGTLDTRLFLAITRRGREKGRKEKRVEKYGGFSNVWGWFTGRYYDSARFFNAPRFVISSPSPFFHVLRTRYLTRRSKKSRRRTLLSLSSPFPSLYCRVFRLLFQIEKTL